MSNQEVCPQCGKVHAPRVNIGKTCNKEELDSFKLIDNKFKCACQAAQPGAIPAGVSQEQATAFISGALASKAEAQWLQQKWWEEMIERYALVGNVYVDAATGEFYTQGH